MQPPAHLYIGRVSAPDLLFALIGILNDTRNLGTGTTISWTGNCLFNGSVQSSRKGLVAGYGIIHAILRLRLSEVPTGRSRML